MRDLDQSSKPAADTERDVQGKPKALEKKGAAAVSTSVEPWFSGSGLKRRMSMRRLFSSHSDSGQDSDLDEDGTQSSLSSWRSRAGAAALTTAVLVAVLGVGAVVISHAGTSTSFTAGGVSQYLHDLAAWHEKAPGGPPSGDPYHVGEGWQACNMHSALPPVRLPPLRQPPPAVGPPGGWDPLEELSLNCSDPAQASRCQAAAEANTYESNMDYVSAAELQEYIKAVGLEGWPGSAPAAVEGGAAAAAAAAAAGDTSLDALALDCEAAPDACAEAAEVNSYEADATNGAADASADAEALAAYGQWAASLRGQGATAADLLEELTAQCGSGEGSEDPACDLIRRVNRYEGGERAVRALRVAEEAAPQYVDVSRLDLDCSDAGDDMQAECERSRAVNRYEKLVREQARAASEQQGEDGELVYPRYLRTGRTPGYDVPAVSPLEDIYRPGVDADYVLQPGLEVLTRARLGLGRTVGYDVPAIDGQPLVQQPQDTEEAEDAEEEGEGSYSGAAQPRMAARRTTGYSVPAVDAVGGLRTAGYDVAAEDAVVLEARAGGAAVERVLPVRRYFKNPCNNPSNRLVFKNLGNNHASRYYYKNPANAPILFTQPLGPSSSAPGAAPGGSLEALLGAWVPFLRQAWLSLVVAVCGGLVLLGGTWWRQHSRAVATACPVPEVATQLLSAAAGAATGAGADTGGAHLLSGAGGRRDGVDVVPEGIDSPRRANTPAPLTTPRTLSRIGGAPGEGAKAGGGREGGGDTTTRE